MLEIFLKKKCDLNVSIADFSKDYNNIDHVVIPKKLSNNFHKLKVTTNSECEIIDIKIDRCSVRALLYFSFVVQDNEIEQPQTWFNQNGVFYFPFLYPLSAFKTLVGNKIDNGYLGKNLFDHFDFYFPEQVNVNENHPEIIKDFFRTDLSFGIFKKGNDWFNNPELPFQSTSYPYDRLALSKELIDNIEKIPFTTLRSKQNALAMREFSNPKVWLNHTFIKNGSSPWKSRLQYQKEEWPILINFLEQFPCDEIINAYMAKLDPLHFIYPHNDGHLDCAPGEAVVYVPITGDVSDNFFKMGNHGFIDLNHINFINRGKFIHALVNDNPNKSRTILSFKFKGKKSDWDKYLVSNSKNVIRSMTYCG